MPIESSGHSRGNPRLYELIEDSPKEGASPTVWAWPQIIDHLKVASQPVQGPWPPHQEPRPDPDAESLPFAVPDRPRAAPPRAPADDAPGSAAETASPTVDTPPTAGAPHPRGDNTSPEA